MNYIFKTITMTMILALIPFMGISAKKKVQKQKAQVSTIATRMWSIWSASAD